MAQSVSQKPTIQFNKGLITEAGELTFPEGASVDELNCSLERDGSRRRRLGLGYEQNFTLDPAASVASGALTSVDTWENAGSKAGLNLIVVQLGSIIHFYEDKGGEISSSRKSFTIDLTSYERPNAVSSANAKVQVASIRGRLVVASPEIDTIAIKYDPDLDSISIETISFRVRDFEWQGDVSTYTTPGTSTDRTYDAKNTGWGVSGGPEEFGNPLTLPWYAGKDANGVYSKTEWDKTYAGSSLIVNGHFTYDLYNINRSANSSGATNYVETSRFSAVTAYAGRMWYAGMGNKNASNIFFSKLVTQDEDLGKCLQGNDPTSEEFPDLLDVDGGFVSIPDAYNITRLHVLGSKLIVFAENGVWTISGIDSTFTPTSYTVSKIANNGLAYEGSFVAEEGNRPYWWSTSGIHTLGVSPENQTLTEQNVSLTTIQSFYNTIRADKRSQVVAAYDSFNKRVGWFYPDNDEGTDYKLNNVLWWDEAIAAFYPWRITDAVAGQHMLFPFYTKGATTSNIDLVVTDSQGSELVDSLGNTVVVTRDGRGYYSSALQVLVRDSSGQVTFAQFTDTEFKDWGSADYESFVEGGIDFVGDMTRHKSLIYLNSYFSVTEEAISGDDILGFTFERPSSCMVSTYWDFKTKPSQTPQEAYRLKDLPVPDGTGPANYPKTVTSSRLRLKGRGKSLRLRFDSKAGHDFHLLGYDRIAGANPR